MPASCSFRASAAGSPACGIEVPARRHNPIVDLVCALHALWAICLIVDASPDNPVMAITGISSTARFFPSRVGMAVLFGGASVMAFCGEFAARRVTAVLWMIPQQVLLLICALGAAQAIFAASFADGVIRTHQFLAADQGPLILLMMFHTTAMFSDRRGA